MVSKGAGQSLRERRPSSGLDGRRRPKQTEAKEEKGPRKGVDKEKRQKERKTRTERLKERKKCTPKPHRTTYPTSAPHISTPQTWLGPSEPDVPSSVATIAMAVREPRRSRRGSTTPPPTTFFRALSISISICVIGFFDAFAPSSSCGINSLRIRATWVVVVSSATVSALDCAACRGGGKKGLASSIGLWTNVWALSSASEIFVGDTSADGALVWLLIMATLSDSAVDFAGLFGVSMIVEDGDNERGDGIASEAAHEPFGMSATPDSSMLERLSSPQTVVAGVVICSTSTSTTTIQFCDGEEETGEGDGDHATPGIGWTACGYAIGLGAVSLRFLASVPARQPPGTGTTTEVSVALTMPTLTEGFLRLIPVLRGPAVETLTAIPCVPLEASTTPT